jgi:hypothetical protein
MNKILAVIMAVTILDAIIVLAVFVPSFFAAKTFPKEDYIDLINELKAEGYHFQTANQPYQGGKVVYLIHCADYSFKGEKTFVDVENNEGIKSTFMIRPDSTFFPQTIAAFLQFQSSGDAVGYEYDCLNRADGNMTLATTMFQAQVTYLKDLGFNLSVTDSHGDVEYNNNKYNSYQIYLQHPELWTENNLLNLPTMLSGYQYFSDSNFHKIVLPSNLGDKVIIELHMDWW